MPPSPYKRMKIPIYCPKGLQEYRNSEQVMDGKRDA